MQNADTKRVFKECVKEKFKYDTDFIDIEAQSIFWKNNVTLALINCAYECNYCDTRDVMINRKVLGAECSFCSKP